MGLPMVEYIKLIMAALCKTLSFHRRKINPSLVKGKLHGTFPLLLTHYVGKTVFQRWCIGKGPRFLVKISGYLLVLTKRNI